MKRSPHALTLALDSSHIHSPKASANLSKQLMERIDVDKKVSEGFMAGVQRMKAEEHKLAVQRGDEPPALS